MVDIRVKELLYAEQERRRGMLVPKIDEYWEKIKDKAQFLICCDKEVCKGFIAYYSNTSTKKAYITMVIVDPSFRGKGIGKGLVSFVLHIAKCSGFSICELEVLEGNIKAYRLYYSLGFRPLTSLMSKDRSRILMEILL